MLRSSPSTKIMRLEYESGSLTQFLYYRKMLNMQKKGKMSLKMRRPSISLRHMAGINLPDPGNVFAKEGDIQVVLIYSCFIRPPSTCLHSLLAFTCFLASCVDGTCPMGPLAL